MWIACPKCLISVDKSISIYPTISLRFNSIPFRNATPTPRCSKRTYSTSLYSAQSCAAISGVSSVEPLSNIINRNGIVLFSRKYFTVVSIPFLSLSLSSKTGNKTVISIFTSISAQLYYLFQACGCRADTNLMFFYFFDIFPTASIFSLPLLSNISGV